MCSQSSREINLLDVEIASTSVLLTNRSKSEKQNDIISPTSGQQSSNRREDESSKREEDALCDTCIKPGKHEEVDTCGLYTCHPTWMNKLANTKCYAILHGFLGMNLLALYSYRVANLTTLEKRFKIPSATSGFIVMGLDLGVTFSSIIMGYFGSRYHMPRLIATGSAITGVACFIALIPHLTYGPGEDALQLTQEYGGVFTSHNGTSNGTVKLCGTVTSNEDNCETVTGSSVPVAIFFVTEILRGIGDSGQLMLGLTFLDDNSSKNRAPVLMAVSACLRMLGPWIGFSVASYTLSQYIDPFLHPVITADDPRWLGAWWMGWAPCGLIAMMLAFIVALFPRQLSDTKRLKQQTIQSRNISIDDFLTAFMKLLRNKTFLLNTFSTVFYVCGFAGFWTFMPKYLETQYGQTASSASLISGSISLVFTGLGIACSAIVITRFKPSARHLAAWCVVVEFITVIGHLSWTFLNCTDHQMQGHVAENGRWNMSDSCSSWCDCEDGDNYNPVCSPDGSTNFFSPCYAGCTSQDTLNGSRIYTNCSCVPDRVAVEGTCPVDCGYNFTIFLVTQCIMNFLGASAKSGNALINFRCVDELDKAFAIGVSELLMGTLAFIPAPIVYGSLLDGACLVWAHKCGNRGNCWLYDGPKLRKLMNLTSTALLTVGALFDVGVWYHCKDLQMYDLPEDDDVKPEDNKKELSSIASSLLT